MILFAGAYLYSVDSKGRVTIPAKFASRLGDFFVVTRGLQGCLWIFTREEWDRLVKKLEPSSLVNSDALALQRYFMGSASEAALDNQSRLAIPSLLREIAAINREVVVVGASTRLEIWSRERWDEFNAQLTDERIESLAREAGL
jgi:MraZ protein